jgi:putative tricarboxylic transport membrane protein
MDFLNIGNITESLGLLLDVYNFLYMIIGISLGIIAGATPGINSGIIVGILLPTTYFMETTHSIMFLTSLYSGTIFAGGITATLINIPGTAAGFVSTFDGYPLTQKGKGAEALGIVLGASVFGGLFGYIALLFFLPIISLIVLKFGPPELLLIVFYAFIIIGLIKESFEKSLIAGLAGLLIGTVGTTIFGVPRGIFGHYAYLEGIPTIPVLIGLVAFSEMISLISKDYITGKTAIVKVDIRPMIKGILYPIKTFKMLWVTIQSSFVGFLVGAVPAAGSAVASFTAYGAAQRSSKNPELYGKGSMEGLTVASTANNASEGGSIGTLMTFGIPGSPTAAFIMIAFTAHGIFPGPFLLKENINMAYFVINGNIIQQILMLLLGLVFIYYFIRLILVPTKIIVVMISILIIVGTLSIRGISSDLFIMWVFGIIGFYMRKLNYPIISLFLGFLLSRMLEGEFTRTVLLYSRDWTLLLSRPLFVFLLSVTLLTVLLPFIKKNKIIKKIN